MESISQTQCKATHRDPGIWSVCVHLQSMHHNALWLQDSPHFVSNHVLAMGGGSDGITSGPKEMDWKEAPRQKKDKQCISTKQKG